MTEDFDAYLGKYATDIEPDALKTLLDDGYSISPKSGRIRKRLRVKEVRPIISKRRAKRYTQTVLWILVAILFILCLIILVPQIETQKKGNNKQSTTK